jgi:transposase
MGHLLDALSQAYRVLGFEDATGGDEVFKQLVLARIIEPTSKLDSARVLAEAGMASASYATLKRRLPVYATARFRAALASACAARAALGPAALVLYDVSTLYFETDAGDGFREPGFSKERRLEPQVTIGLLTDASGFPLMLNAFEGNKAETATMLPVLRSFQGAHGITGITVVADAGMLSRSNQIAIEAAGLSFILGARTPSVPYVITQWRREHPDEPVPDGLLLTESMPATPSDGRGHWWVYHRYSHDRGRRTLKGITEQVAKAEKAVAGQVPVKRNRFIRLQGGTRSVNRDLEAKARTLAGWKGYVTNLPPERANADFVIGAYHRLYQIERSFRMSKHDLQARPIFHHKRESIEAHLAVVFAALAVTRHIEASTNWSIKKFVTTTRRYREVVIQAGDQLITAADPIPDELRTAIEAISAPKAAH